ncbi:MAG: hypothetical protein ACRDPA_19475, partial [Solirubrobacteraceae bacterium]
MTIQNVPEISLDELAITLEAYAGPPRPRRQRVQRHWRPWRFAWAAAALVLVFVGAAYAAGFNPFAGISAADHPATSNDTLPASLAAHIAEFSSTMEQMGHGHLLLDSTRFITQVPSGMRFYTIATSAGGLCLATVDPPGTNATGGLGCGDTLSQSRPITIGSEQPNPATPPVSYGLALDGVTGVSFMAGGAESTVPVTDNVLAYE